MMHFKIVADGSTIYLQCTMHDIRIMVTAMMVSSLYSSVLVYEIPSGKLVMVM